ncbi:hypothetical protein MC885_006690 [Smutsia gigantea]|nr:hypothetical protein MC885_006690 [Smutsia gigantea]
MEMRCTRGWGVPPRGRGGTEAASQGLGGSFSEEGMSDQGISAGGDEGGGVPRVPPTIEGTGRGPRRVKAIAGRPLALQCVARGHPPPTLSWYHEGLPVAESNGTWLEAGGSVLSLESLGTASGGLYSCVARGPAGEAVLQYSVEVQVPPQLLVAEGLGQVTALVGQTLELPCQASGAPVPTIQWLQNGRPAEELAGVRVASQGTTLHINRVELGHAGLFACQATNEAGTAGAEVELSVHELPSVVISGGENITAPFLQPVTLQCVGTGVPTPSLRWWKDGVALVASRGNLQIEKVDLKDDGVYTCAATNLAGESRRAVALKVLVPPNIEPGPLSKAVLENASVTLECLASGVPPPGKTPALHWKPPPAGPWPLNNEAGHCPSCLSNTHYIASLPVCQGPEPLHWCLKQICKASVWFASSQGCLGAGSGNQDLQVATYLGL